MTRTCAWCRVGIPETSRVDARHCSTRCRQAAHRASIRRLELEATDAPLRLAYADPPYPGHASIYRDHPDFAGEVDHRVLLSRLATYDGWALSTSAAAVPAIAALCVAEDLGARLAIWVRPPRPHATARILTGFEAVFVSPARRVVRAQPEHVARIPLLRVTDVLVGVAARRRPTLPTSLVGMKTPAFCEWIFRLLGALPGDSLDDLYPGSGIVSRSWRLYTSAGSSRNASPDVADALALTAATA